MEGGGRRLKEGNALCLQCHQAWTYDDAGHHFHPKAWKRKPSEGVLCVKRLARLAPLLSDPLRAVRLDAAAALAGTPPTLLKPYQREALEAGVADYVST